MLDKIKSGPLTKRWVMVGAMILLIIILVPLENFVIHPWLDSLKYWNEDEYEQGKFAGRAIYLLDFARGTSLGLHRTLTKCGLPENLANLDTLEKAGIDYANREPIVYSYRDGEFFMFSVIQIGSGVFEVKCSSYEDTKRGTPPIVHVVSWQEMGDVPGGVLPGVFTRSSFITG